MDSADGNASMQECPITPCAEATGLSCNHFLLMRITLLLLLVTVSAIAQPSAFGPAHQPPVIPEAVVKLLQWPSGELITRKGVAAGATNVIAAVFGAESWLRGVVDASWLPPAFEPLCIASEFESRDVVRHKWVKKDHAFMVAQTGSIFVMEIRPATARFDGDSKEARLLSLRKLSSDVFVKTGKRFTAQGGRVPIPGLNSKIVGFSFDSATTRAVTNQTVLLFGRPRTMEEEGVIHAGDSVQSVKEDSKANSAWEKSAFAWRHWFRSVYWFADEQRLVVFFLKEEGGPVALSFGGSADNKWFIKGSVNGIDNW